MQQHTDLVVLARTELLEPLVSRISEQSGCSAMSEISVIGLGAMGSALARTLVAVGSFQWLAQVFSGFDQNLLPGSKAVVKLSPPQTVGTTAAFPFPEHAPKSKLQISLLL